MLTVFLEINQPIWMHECNFPFAAILCLFIYAFPIDLIFRLQFKVLDVTKNINQFRSCNLFKFIIQHLEQRCALKCCARKRVQER